MEHPNKNRIVITGLGVVSSIGLGWKIFWESLLAGRSGIRRITYLDTSHYDTHFGGEVEGFDPLQFMPAPIAKRLGRGSQFAIAATKMALEDAQLTSDELQRARAGICLGTTMADIQPMETIDEDWVKFGESRIPASLISRYPSCTMSVNVATHFRLFGPNMMIPTACAAGNYAISYATDLLRAGRADVMIVGGTEPFSRIIFTGFNRLSVVAPDYCRPFDKFRKGIIPAEGAGILILEQLDDALARHAPIYAEILGYGISCDATHMTIPKVEGLISVLNNALSHAGLGLSDVDYINAHGTGTPANDQTECAAIRAIFGSRTDYIPISSIKSMIGHAMGAASALEAIACTLAVCNDYIPPTINFETPDPQCRIDCVPNISRRHKVAVALNNSFAFGGNNACVAFGKLW